MNTKNSIKNPFCVISIATYGEYGMHDIQTNTAWNSNPYGEAYAVVPDDMVEGILETQGFCNLILNKEGTEVVRFIAGEIPKIEPTQPLPTETERIRADIDYIAVMTGVEL